MFVCCKAVLLKRTSTIPKKIICRDFLLVSLKNGKNAENSSSNGASSWKAPFKCTRANNEHPSKFFVHNFKESNKKVFCSSCFGKILLYFVFIEFTAFVVRSNFKYEVMSQ